MSAKLEKLGIERDKARIKRDEWDARFQDLDQRYKEQENEEIHDMVHAYHLSLEQLSVLLSAAKAGAPDPENMEQIMGDSEADPEE